MVPDKPQKVENVHFTWCGCIGFRARCYVKDISTLYNCCQIEIYFDLGNVKWSRYSLLSFNVSYDGELGRSGIHGGGGLCNAFIVCFSQGQVSFSVVL